MSQHCSTSYANSSGSIISLDVDEFLLATVEGDSVDMNIPSSPFDGFVNSNVKKDKHYPLYSLLSSLKEACVPIKVLPFANVGIRDIALDEGVLEMHIKRKAKDMNPTKVLSFKV